MTPVESPRVNAEHGVLTYRAAAGSSWYAMAAIRNGGLVLEWVLRTLDSNWREVYDVALDQTRPGADGLLFLPYLIGERSSSAPAAWIGLREIHDRRHLLRAALEGVAFATRMAFESVDELGRRAPQLSGGSTAWPSWPALLASVFDRPLSLRQPEPTSAQGAALLAAHAVGHKVTAPVRDEVVVEPDVSAARVYAESYRRFIELHRERA